MRDALWTPNPFTVTPFSVSTSGDNLIVSGVPGKQIHIFRMKMASAATVNVTIHDSVAVVFDGPIPLLAGFPWILPFSSIDNPAWYETSIGAGFVINLSATVLVGGNIEYLVV